MIDWRFTRLAGTSLLLVVLAAACGETTRKDAPPEILPGVITPEIGTFGVAPAEIEAGATATLHWTARNVVAIAIADEDGNPVSVDGLDPTRGSVTVQPEANTSYTLTATGADPAAGQAWRTVSVFVRPAPVESPVIDEFIASPSSVALGSEVVLKWRTTHAATIAIKDDGDLAVTPEDADPAAGQVAVRPIRSPTVYHLTAVGPQGRRAVAQVSVEISGLPRITRFFLDPLVPVHPGGTVTLYWETENTSHVVIRQGDAVLVDTTTELSGSRAVSLADTATFSIEASGAENTVATATALARVGPSIEAFSASERVVRANDPVTLSWSITDADRAVIDGPGGYHLAIPNDQLASGSASINVTDRGDFVLQALRRDVPQTAAIAIDVTLAPRIRSLTVDQTQITAALGHPGSVTLSWVQDGADTCSILANGSAAPGFESFPCGPTGTATVQLTATATLRLVAENAHGSDTRTASVEAFPPARIVAFAANPSRRVSPGDTVELSWEVDGATAITLEKDGAALPIGATNFNGSTNDQLFVDSVYVITAQNVLGFPTHAQLTARAGAPVILTAVAEPDFVAIGSAFELFWTADGGDQLTVTGPGGELFSTSVPAEIDAGHTTLLAPVEAGEYTYTLTSVNGGGAHSLDVLVKASDGPMIRSFTVTPNQISLGESVTFTWSVDDDAAGNTPVLSLTDNYGHDYTTELAGKDPNNGALTITPEEEGQHVYIFTASTEPGRMVATITTVVEVTVPPFLHTFTATPDTVSTQGGTVVPEVELAWTSENAVEVSLWATDEFGNAVPPAFHRLSLANGDPQSALDAGAFTVGPTQTTRYIARARNRVGTEVEKKLKVIVDPPEILSFVATPPEITEGGTSVLSWTTRNADYVRFKPVLVSEITEPLIDLSATGTPVTMTGTADAGRWSVTFPPGFVFPWFGTQPTGLVATTDGWITFNTAYASTDFSNSNLPDSTNPDLAMAVFWDDGMAYGTTQFLWELRQAPEGQHLVLHWKGHGMYSGPTGDFNYEIVLWENGDFDFRYGDMSHTTAGRAEGNSATIGFQSPDRSQSHVLTFDAAVPGGVAHRSVRYQLAQPATGSVTMSPLSTTTYTITAVNVDAEAEAETQIVVWKTPVLSYAGSDPVAPTAGVPFEINWTVKEANQIRVLDQNGAVICVVTDPDLIPNGSCTHVETAPGAKTYTVEAANGPAGSPLSVVTRTFQLVVMTNLAVTSFEVLPGEFVDPGEQLTINWSSTGGVYMSLLACAPGNPMDCNDITPVGANPNAGTLSFPATQSREFWFYVFDQYTRDEVASQNVWVGAATLDSFTATATVVGAGTAVTLTWATTDADTVTMNPSPPPPPPTEVTATAPFIDISTTGSSVPMDGTEDSGRYLVNFPAGFTFPWFGTQPSGLIATTDGWITFDTAYNSSNFSNAELPGTNASLALAPLWDDGKVYTGSTELYYELRQSPAGRHLVIQWKGIGFYGTPPVGDLNYEVVLWENGNFDFRYDSMTAPDQARANGNSATIGFRSPDGTVYHQMSYNAEVSGGLSHRSWRFTVGMPLNGSLIVTPAETTTYKLCATNESLYQACEEIRVVVVKPGDLLFTEAMIRPANPEAEWFELRNLTAEPIDLAGWNLSSGAGELYVIPTTTPVIVPPRGYLVFARSGDPAVNGGLIAPHVYGNALTLVDATDALQLYLGATMIDSILWDANWTIPATGSLEFEVSKMARNHTANDAFANWCASTASYGDGTLAGSPGATGNGCLNTGAYQYYLFDPFAASMPFIDIASTGTDDSAILSATYYTPAIPLGFTMPYFGDQVSSMHITKHGYIAFPTQTTYYSANASIPSTSAPNGFVAPFWDYLYTSSGVSMLHHQQKTVDGHKVMIIQWTDVSGGSTTYGSLDFQIQLWEDGDIAFVYRDLIKLNATYGDYNQGSSATIGIENNAGNQAIQVFYGSTSTGGPIRSGTTYLFKRKPAPPVP